MSNREREKTLGETQPTTEGRLREALWNRIIKLRRWLVFSGLFVGAGLLAVANYFTLHAPHPHWMNLVPWGALTGGAFSVVLIAFAYELVMRADNDALATERLRRELRHSTDHLWETVSLTSASSLSFFDQLNSNALDTIGVASLAARLRDPELAADWYDTAIAQMLRDERRRTSYEATLSIAPVTDNDDAEIVRRYFYLWVTRRYRTTLLKDTFTFTTAKDYDTYDHRQRSGVWDVVIVSKSGQPFSEFDPAQQLMIRDMRVGTLLLKLDYRWDEASGEIIVTANNPDLYSLVGNEVIIEYSYRYFVRKTSQMCTNFIAFPTKDPVIKFDCSAAEAEISDVVPMFTSAGIPNVRYIPDAATGEPPHVAIVALSGWSLPKSGVVFGWTLREPTDGRPRYGIPASISQRLVTDSG